jgi:hypothetical protein
LRRANHTEKHGFYKEENMKLTKIYATLDEAEMLIYKAKNNEGELGKEYLQMAKDMLWSLKYKVEKEMEEEKDEDREAVEEEPSGTETVE